MDANRVKADHPLIAVLVTREHSRLMSQIKSLEGLIGEPYSASKTNRLRKMAERWRHTLCYDDGVAPLVAALDDVINAYEKRSSGLEKAHDELNFAAGVYKMGHWHLVRFFFPTVKSCLNDFGGVKPSYRKAFKARYEPDKPLSVEDQAQLLKAQYALIPNRRDPYNIRTPKPDKPAKAEGKPRKAGKPELRLVKSEARPEQKAQRTKKVGVMARLMSLLGKGQ